jgi:SsrA-binding protein
MEVISLNKKAYHNFEMITTYCCGVILFGTEVKSIRLRKVDFNDSYCFFVKNELWLKNFHISEYKFGNYNNHEPKRDRKLLLTKKELIKLKKQICEKGLTLIPIKLFINDRGLIKLDISLARGKNKFNKKEDIKLSDLRREENRNFKK